MATAGQAELVFVVDVTSLTKEGFVGSTRYEGETVDLNFDDGDEGLFLTSEMAGRLHVKRGSKVLLVVENDRNITSDSVVSGVGKTVRISSPKVYHEVGRGGGAVIRLRKI